MSAAMHAEVLRTSWTQDADRIELVATVDGWYRVGTKWAWLMKSRELRAAANAFGMLEMLDLGEVLAADLAPLLARAARGQLDRHADLVRAVELVQSAARRVH